jgi:DNA-binding response OmpR family regulator
VSDRESTRTLNNLAAVTPRPTLRNRLAFLRTTQETASPPGKILLIDDSFISLDAVSAFLEDMGWTVLTAQSGVEALKMASTPDLDLVISDLNMPDMNGIEVFRRIYAMDPMLPVIILSEEGAVSSVLESVHAGVFDFVPKSDHFRMLPAAVMRAVAHCRILRENRRLSQDLIRVNEGLEHRVAEQARLLEERLRREATWSERRRWLPCARRSRSRDGFRRRSCPPNTSVLGCRSPPACSPPRRSVATTTMSAPPPTVAGLASATWPATDSRRAWSCS